MSTTIFEPDKHTIMRCKDCDYQTRDAVEFVDHAHHCPVNPVPLPQAEIERLKNDKQILTGESTEVNGGEVADDNDN